MGKRILSIFCALLLVSAGVCFGADPFVEDVQTRLKAMGFEPGPAPGLWGPETEKALLLLQKAKGLPETGTLDPGSLKTLFANTSVEVLYRAYSRNLRTGSRASAEKYLDLILLFDPNHFKALLFKGRFLESRGAFKEAAHIYHRCLETNENNKMIWNSLGRVQCRLKQYDEAEISFQKAVDAAPNEPVIHHDRGLCRLRMGRYHLAEEDFDEETSLLDEIPRPEFYLVKRILRQMDGIDLPSPDWRPDYESYVRDEALTRPSGYLLDLIRTQSAPGPSKPDVGAPRTRLTFGGSEKEPLEYAPNLAVWGGAVIHDPEQGVLLENGTHFRHTQVSLESREIIISYGVVDGWKMVPEKTEKKPL